MEKMEGLTAARLFVDTYYPECVAAILHGSVARNEARQNSDLDILIIVNDDINFYRKIFHEYGWIIETGISSRRFNEEKVQHPTTNHAPSYITSFAEGIILKDQNNFAKSLKERAIEILEQSPNALSQQEIDQYRHIITDWLDDFIDCISYEEEMFIVHDLAIMTAQLLLAYNRQWIGERKWMYRVLYKSDHQYAKQLIIAMEHFYRSGEKGRLIDVIESILMMVGGKLY